MSLIDEMKKSLPIPVYPTSELAKYLSEKGIMIDANTELNITQVFDSGESGGIMAHILDVDGEVIIVSLTHLRVKPGHPLSKKIQSYQKKRRKGIRFGLKDFTLRPRIKYIKHFFYLQNFREAIGFNRTIRENHY